MKISRFELGSAQKLAGALLLLLLAQCVWVVNRQQMSARDYRFARCGREMWETPSPLAGYFTTCGNLNGDGTFAYRLAGLPLTLQRLALLAGDQLRRRENRLYVGGTLNGTTWEARHQIGSVKWLIHLPFVGFALWLGAGLWWVSRRMFGNEGASLALGLYCFCPAMVRFAVFPNNEVLAMWGLYGLVYTAIGVAHALQGPRRKWRPRIVLLVAALGLTAAAHLLAAMVGFTAAAVLMLYLGERRRSYVIQVLIFALLGALAVLFAFYAFHAAPFSYVLSGGGARFWFTLENAWAFAKAPAELPIVALSALSAALYLALLRSRYFGNTVPLVMTLLLCCLRTTQTVTMPWLWALPFLFTFVGGVFADVFETRRRKLYLAVAGIALVTQAVACVDLLPSLAR